MYRIYTLQIYWVKPVKSKRNLIYIFGMIFYLLFLSLQHSLTHILPPTQTHTQSAAVSLVYLHVLTSLNERWLVNFNHRRQNVWYRNAVLCVCVSLFLFFSLQSAQRTSIHTRPTTWNKLTYSSFRFHCSIVVAVGSSRALYVLLAACFSCAIDSLVVHTHTRARVEQKTTFSSYVHATTCCTFTVSAEKSDV